VAAGNPRQCGAHRPRRGEQAAVQVPEAQGWSDGEDQICNPEKFMHGELYWWVYWSAVNSRKNNFRRTTEILFGVQWPGRGGKVAVQQVPEAYGWSDGDARSCDRETVTGHWSAVSSRASTRICLANLRSTTE